MKLIILVSVFLLFIISGCKEKIVETPIPPVYGEAEIRIKILEIIDAESVKIELAKLYNERYWSAFVQAAGGGDLLFEYFYPSGALMQITGLSPSFDYEINTGLEVKSFSLMKNLALKTIPGSLINWRFKMNKNKEWEYRFTIENNQRLFDVRINAHTGEIIKAF